jgi:hypothetical protein
MYYEAFSCYIPRLDHAECKLCSSSCNSACYFHRHRSTYSAQHPVSNILSLCSSLNVRLITPIRNVSQNNGFAYFGCFHIEYRKTKYFELTGNYACPKFNMFVILSWVQFRFVSVIPNHVRWVPCYHGMVRPQVADGGDTLQFWRVTANILNKPPWTADKGLSSSFGVGRGINNSSP